LMIQRSPQPDEILEYHTTPTSLSMLPPRWGWSRGDLIVRGAAATTWAPPLQTLTLKIKNEALKTRGKALPSTRAEIHCASMSQRP
jgi:hypothetical protein